MYDFIEGILVEKNPAYCVIETGGFGYFVQISLPTFSWLENQQRVRLYIHQVVREDALLLFGFQNKEEREMFRLLLTVSGIGANTARMILSSLASDELQQVIQTGNTAVLQSIKGIGLKTAQRIIIDLNDKISKEKISGELFPLKDNSLKDEALSALVILGFNKGEAEKTIGKILMENKTISLEELIRKALKLL
jgi:holliday junction DNA helicase RuvA